MLSEILNLIKNGKSCTIQQLAEHLEAPPEEVQRSIEYLEYLDTFKKSLWNRGAAIPVKTVMAAIKG